jgi:hypothetical protein
MHVFFFLLSMKIHPTGHNFFLLVWGQTIGTGAAVGVTGAAVTGARVTGAAVGATGAAVTGAAVTGAAVGAFGASHDFFFLLSMKIHPTGHNFFLLVWGQTIGAGAAVGVTGAAVTGARVTGAAVGATGAEVVCKSRRPVVCPLPRVRSSTSRTSSPPPPLRD